MSQVLFLNKSKNSKVDLDQVPNIRSKSYSNVAQLSCGQIIQNCQKLGYNINAPIFWDVNGQCKLMSKISDQLSKMYTIIHPQHVYKIFRVEGCYFDHINACQEKSRWYGINVMSKIFDHLLHSPGYFFCGLIFDLLQK